LAAKISKITQKVDFLFNIAGIGIYKSIEDLSLDDWQLSMDVNATTPFLMVKYLMPLLKKSSRALVLNIGSGMGVYGSANRAAYCSSKFALRGLSLSLSKEYKDKGVDFCLLTLGSVMTDFGSGGIEKRKKLQREGKKYLSPEDVAEKIVETITSSNKPSEIVFYPKNYESESKGGN